MKVERGVEREVEKMGVLSVLNKGRRWTIFGVAGVKGVAGNSLMGVFFACGRCLRHRYGRPAEIIGPERNIEAF